ncbi:MAG: hypothetical protein KU28_09460 [Sulfurovum sp. PC08-66]|nr:MAG: hypothetical protein KU28_09460 [Sulfurovum sp. PC08-66]
MNKIGTLLNIPTQTLHKAYKITKTAGLEYVYIGNLHDCTHQSTYCPRYNELLNLKQEGI